MSSSSIHIAILSFHISLAIDPLDSAQRTSEDLHIEEKPVRHTASHARDLCLEISRLSSDHDSREWAMIDNVVTSERDMQGFRLHMLKESGT